MKAKNLVVLAVALLLAGLWAAPLRAEDVTNSRDYPLLTRLPKFEITSYEQNYDAVDFADGPESSQSLEGQKYALTYYFKGENHPSELQIIRNYANAIKKLGGEVVYENVSHEGTRQGTYKLLKGDKEIWFSVVPLDDGQSYNLTVLEKGEMPQEVGTGELQAALEKDGRVALYLNFDTDKADLKPEAQPVLEKVVALMQDNPSLKLSVEGHTDNKGAAPRNKTLSEQRAQAVMKALVSAGVAAGRLSAQGFGQEKPLASNATEEGRAQNRRVELVKK